MEAKWTSFYKAKYDEWHIGVPADGGNFNVALANDGILSGLPKDVRERIGNQIADGMNALAGIPNPAAVADVVEALREARTTIVITRTNIMTEISRYSDASESRWAGVPEQLQKRIDNIDAALAKLDHPA